MKKQRIFSIALAAFLSIGCLGACSGGGNDSVVSQADPNEKAEIEFYVWAEKALCEEIADSFETIYPNWKVKVTLATSDYYQSLQTYSGANIMPDIFYMQPGYISDFCRDRLLLNLQPYLDAGEDLTKEDLWTLNDSYRYDTQTEKLGSGDLYAYIKDFTPEFMMIYNKSHIDEYNETHDVSLAAEVGYPTDDGVYPSTTKSMSWSQNERMCRLLSKFDNNGNFTRYGSNFGFEPWSHLGEFVSQLGGTMFNADGYMNADSPEMIAALEHLKNYMDGETASSVKIGSSVVNDGMGFRNGDISVLFTGRWAFQQYDWDNAEFDIGVAPAAMPEAEQETKMVSAMVGIAISAESKYPAVAYKFVEYYMTYGQKLLSKKGFNIPGNKTIAYKDYVDTGDAEVDELNAYFLSMVDKCEMVEVNPWLDYGSIGTVYGMELSRAWGTADRLTAAQALLAAKSTIDTKVDQNKNRYGN